MLDAVIAVVPLLKHDAHVLVCVVQHLTQLFLDVVLSLIQTAIVLLIVCTVMLLQDVCHLLHVHVLLELCDVLMAHVNSAATAHYATQKHRYCAGT